MAVQVLVDHGVPEAKIVFVTYFAGRMGLVRLTKVFPEVRVVVCSIVADYEERVCDSFFSIRTVLSRPTTKHGVFKLGDALRCLVTNSDLGLC